MKKSLILVGTQWGDEGKGKIVDYFSQKFDAVCRFQGGHNAGLHYDRPENGIQRQIFVRNSRQSYPCLRPPIGCRQG